MRRMNYPRFDKPTYVGTFDSEQSGFITNTTPEPGIYFVIIKDPEAMQQYSCTFTVATNTNTSCSWFSIGATEPVYLDYNLDYENVISINSGSPEPVHAGATIELYKLN